MLDRTARTAACLAAAVALLAGTAATEPASAARPAPAERTRTPITTTSPFTTMRLAVDPTSAAARAAADARARGDRATANALDVLARQPQAAWYGDWTPTSTVAADVARRTADRTRTHVLALYAVPHRDCGSYSAGGLGPAEYRRWVREVARGLAGRRAVVVLEPDALAMLDCVPTEAKAERLHLLHDAVGVLVATGALVYVDAGHAAWIPPQVMAARLRAVGVGRARGVSVNVSGFATTSASTAYASALAAHLPGLKAVVDTSRNGNGPAPDAAWCNPTGRALGATPRPARDRVVEALLWVKRPGESDGECGRGEPPAGAFWVEQALALVAARA